MGKKTGSSRIVGVGSLRIAEIRQKRRTIGVQVQVHLVAMRVADKIAIEQTGGNRLFQIAILQDSQAVSSQMAAVISRLGLDGCRRLLEFLSDRRGEYVLSSVCI